MRALAELYRRHFEGVVDEVFPRFVRPASFWHDVAAASARDQIEESALQQTASTRRPARRRAAR